MTSTVRLWNYQGGSLLCFKGCKSVALDPDGKIIVFVDAEGLTHKSNLPFDVAEEKQ